MQALAEQAARGALSAEAMRQAIEGMMTGALPPHEIKALLTALAARGETAQELAAAVQAVRAHAVPLPLAHTSGLCDTCGTGGDGQGTFNISTLAALVAAAAGVRVVKHGNRAASSRCGSADVLEALGVNIQATPQQVARCVEEAGFGFCFAPTFHPAMKAVGPIRRKLGIRTIFNLIGPLANPAPLTYQLVGVAQEQLMPPVADTLRVLGIRRGMVVHGLDGLDEATTTAATRILSLSPGAMDALTIQPDEFGYARVTMDALRGGDAQANAAIATAVLAGKRSAHRDIVALNAGCAIYVAEQAGTLQEGVKQAEAALSDGRARTLLDRVIALSNA